jgi:hypothetical protein
MKLATFLGALLACLALFLLGSDSPAPQPAVTSLDATGGTEMVVALPEPNEATMLRVGTMLATVVPKVAPKSEPEIVQMPDSFEVRTAGTNRTVAAATCSAVGKAVPGTEITNCGVFGPVQTASAPGSTDHLAATGGTILRLFAPEEAQTDRRLATLQARIRAAVLDSAGLSSVESWTVTPIYGSVPSLEVHLPFVDPTPQRLAALLAPVYVAYGCAQGASNCPTLILESVDDFSPLHD